MYGVMESPSDVLNLLLAIPNTFSTSELFNGRSNAHHSTYVFRGIVAAQPGHYLSIMRQTNVDKDSDSGNIIDDEWVLTDDSNLFKLKNGWISAIEWMCSSASKPKMLIFE